MNKKDYKAIAEIIKKYHMEQHKCWTIIKDLADYFEKEAMIVKDKDRVTLKINFDRKQFLKECGVEK